MRSPHRWAKWPRAADTALGDLVARFEPAHAAALERGLLRRLGVGPTGRDRPLCAAVLDFLETSQIEFERLFFDWYGGCESADRATASPAAELYRWGPFEAKIEAIRSLGEALGVPV